jgi:hypothetical protein
VSHPYRRASYRYIERRAPTYDPHGGADPWKDLPPDGGASWGYDPLEQPPMEGGIGVGRLGEPMPFPADHGLEPLGDAPRAAGPATFSYDQVPEVGRRM